MERDCEFCGHISLSFDLSHIAGDYLLQLIQLGECMCVVRVGGFEQVTFVILKMLDCVMTERAMLVINWANFLSTKIVSLARTALKWRRYQLEVDIGECLNERMDRWIWRSGHSQLYFICCSFNFHFDEIIRIIIFKLSMSLRQNVCEFPCAWFLCCCFSVSFSRDAATEKMNLKNKLLVWSSSYVVAGVYVAVVIRMICHPKNETTDSAEQS